MLIILILRPDSSNASPHTFFLFDMSVKENPDDLFIFDCIAQNSVHLPAQVCETTMKSHISLFEIFLQRYLQISLHIFPKLEQVLIDAKSQDIPLLTTLLRKNAKYITAPTWQNLLAFRIDKESLDVFMDLGALEHIGAEHVKEYLIHVCWGSSKLTFNTWLGLLDRFDLNLISTITEHGPKRLGSPSITLFECAIGHCDYESIKLARGELGAHRCCLSKSIQIFCRVRQTDKVKLFLDKGFDPMQSCCVDTLIP